MSRATVRSAPLHDACTCSPGSRSPSSTRTTRIPSPSSGSSWSGRPTRRAIASSRGRGRARASPRRWRATADRGRRGGARVRRWPGVGRLAGALGIHSVLDCRVGGEASAADGLEGPVQVAAFDLAAGLSGPRPGGCRRRHGSPGAAAHRGHPVGRRSSCSRTRGNSSSPSWTPAARVGWRPVAARWRQVMAAAGGRHPKAGLAARRASPPAAPRPGDGLLRVATGRRRRQGAAPRVDAPR